MAPISGLLGSVAYTTGGTTLIVGISEWSLDFGMEPVETTQFGDRWKTFIASVQEFSGSFSGRGDTDASQATMRNAALGGSAVALRLYDGTANYYNIGTALLTGMSPSISNEGRGDISYDFQGSGGLTYV